MPGAPGAGREAKDRLADRRFWDGENCRVEPGDFQIVASRCLSAAKRTNSQLFILFRGFD